MIFFDANFIISLYIKKHKYHHRAVEMWNDIKEDKEERIISNLIIPEVITVLNVKLKQDKDILNKVFYAMLTDFTIVNDLDSYYNGFLNVLKHKNRLPLFDGVYMAIMEDLEIKKIASFDKHFDDIKGISRIG
ncbi:type II toxin-antitoxin system VapC family toxin [Methanobrevibacter filiformis]|uniref:tRNA(FMet)-specific endonuclease VapC n=1 Tax=Methanobrevibacter filiformis TaxID=55758 RepID=A0A166AEV7_9EURY|nr:type II toxin-antitoxin system VapC family toxin [Methanobrevibacter filiformis]KZX11942.1 tRNA(fMet)-specific endonuclease VapC [Methanobrevibacter filiformis]